MVPRVWASFLLTPQRMKGACSKITYYRRYLEDPRAHNPPPLFSLFWCTFSLIPPLLFALHCWACIPPPNAAANVGYIFPNAVNLSLLLLYQTQSTYNQLEYPLIVCVIELVLFFPDPKEVSYSLQIAKTPGPCIIFISTRQCNIWIKGN